MLTTGCSASDTDCRNVRGTYEEATGASGLARAPRLVPCAPSRLVPRAPSWTVLAPYPFTAPPSANPPPSRREISTYSSTTGVE